MIKPSLREKFRLLLVTPRGFFPDKLLRPICLDVPDHGERFLVQAVMEFANQYSA